MSERPDPKPSAPSWGEVVRSVGQYMDLGLTFVGMIGGGALGGYWLDTRFATSPWWLLTGACLGILAGFYHFLSVVLRK